jgi:hypothetical protein
MKPIHSTNRKTAAMYANKDGREKPSTADKHRFTQISVWASDQSFGYGKRDRARRLLLSKETVQAANRNLRNLWNLRILSFFGCDFEAHVADPVNPLSLSASICG